MKIELDELDVFEGLAKKMRISIVKNLKDCLKKTSLSDDDKKEICSEFLAELCVNLDQGEWEHEGFYYRPAVSFIKGNLQFWDNETVLIPPYQAYQHHDKVWGEIDEIYDNN